jgi:hypothetical protein
LYEDHSRESFKNSLTHDAGSESFKCQSRTYQR